MRDDVETASVARLLAGSCVCLLAYGAMECGKFYLAGGAAAGAIYAKPHYLTSLNPFRLDSLWMMVWVAASGLLIWPHKNCGRAFGWSHLAALVAPYALIPFWPPGGVLFDGANAPSDLFIPLYVTVPMLAAFLISALSHRYAIPLRPVLAIAAALHLGLAITALFQKIVHYEGRWEHVEFRAAMLTAAPVGILYFDWLLRLRYYLMTALVGSIFIWAALITSSRSVLAAALLAILAAAILHRRRAVALALGIALALGFSAYSLTRHAATPAGPGRPTAPAPHGLITRGIESNGRVGGVWSIGLGILKRHPLTGIGPSREAFVREHAALVAEGRRYSCAPGEHAWPHNVFLHIGVMAGIPAILAFLALAGVAVRAYLQTRAPAPAIALLGLVLVIGNLELVAVHAIIFLLTLRIPKDATR